MVYLDSCRCSERGLFFVIWQCRCVTIRPQRINRPFIVARNGEVSDPMHVFFLEFLLLFLTFSFV